MEALEENIEWINVDKYRHVDDSYRTFSESTFFPKVFYDEKKRDGILKVELNCKLLSLWLNPLNGYTKQVLGCCLSLSSSYGVSIYNLICRCDKGKSLSVDRLRKYLDISEDKYPDWAQFKRAVLAVSKKDIERAADYILNWEVTKKRVERYWK